MDQHVFAEWREIKMVPKALARSLRSRGEDGVLAMIPALYTLNKGHVSFFYDKGKYLELRHAALTCELASRGYEFDAASVFDSSNVYSGLDSRFNQDYSPPAEALRIVRERIALRISERPGWYRYRGTIVG